MITAAFTPPVSATRIRDDAGFYDNAGICGQCGDLPYCQQHWHVTQSGLGTFPPGHSKSLDPHWSPDDSQLPRPRASGDHQYCRLSVLPISRIARSSTSN